MKTIKILLADDHILIRNGIKLLLKNDAKFEVVAEAANGLEAIDFLRKNPDLVDVVLMDINMGVMNGIEATQIVSDDLPRYKILALTMHIEETYISDMIKAGALGYILKDCNIEELGLAIKTVYSGKKYYSNEVSVVMINSLMNAGNNDEPSDLTTREIEVLSFVSGGLTNIEIGSLLNISRRTVETHRRNILGKLDVKNTAEMVRFAIQNNLVE